MSLRRFVIALLAPALLAAAPAASPIQGLDHMPVAVTDLDGAARDFARLGFSIKPGRPHDDGIRNRHVKFPNGGEIELITASSPTDALARDYADWIKGGDGPAWWSLYSPDLPGVTAFLAARKLAPQNAGDLVNFPQNIFPHRLFIADRLRSPTDGPQYWTHPNTAYKLRAVWLAKAPAERRLLLELGAKAARRSACAPFDQNAELLTLPGEGDQVMISPALARSPDRSIVGATVLVSSLATARRVLDANQVSYRVTADCPDQGVWIPPTEAHGLWLEFREPSPDDQG